MPLDVQVSEKAWSSHLRAFLTDRSAKSDTHGTCYKTYDKGVRSLFAAPRASCFFPPSFDDMASHGTENNVRLFEDLDPDNCVYLGADADGDLVFRTDLNSSEGQGRSHLTERHLVALGLTDICCKVGKGKVFYLPIPESPAFLNAKKSEDKTSSVYLYNTLPKLIYMPFVWGEEDQRVWREMPLSVRHILLNARGLGIMRIDCVMPMDLTYEPTEGTEIKLNGYNSADTGTKALLVIVPRAYLGWCDDVQERGQSTMEDGNGAWIVAHGETLAKYQQLTAEDVVCKLWDMYFGGVPRSLCRFEEILKAVVEFDAAWAAKQGGTTQRSGGHA